MAVSHPSRGLVALTAATLLLGEPWAIAAPGDLDPTFGGDGIVLTDIGNGTGTIDVLHAIAVQPDGMIVAVGDSQNNFAVARYVTDGDLDPTFGGDGTVVTPIGVSDDEAFGVAIQSDDKVVVVGRSIQNNLGYDFAVARYETDGDLDPTFGGGDGLVTTALHLGDDYAIDVAVQPDGGIVAAGFTGGDTNTKFAIVRYESDGDLDPTFSGDGIKSTNFNKLGDFAKAVTLQDDGGIVAAGSARVPGKGDDIAVARYTSSGELDPTFSQDGKIKTSLGPDWDYANDAAILPNGKILVAGCAHCFGAQGGSFMLARYRTGGSLDPRFSGDGVQTTGYGSGDDIVYGIGLLPDGSIAAGGCSACFSNFDVFAVARYLKNGTLDSAFSSNGKTTTDLGPGVTGDPGQALIVQSDGAIVVGGCAACYSDASDFGLAMYLP